MLVQTRLCLSHSIHRLGLSPVHLKGSHDLVQASAPPPPHGVSLAALANQLTPAGAPATSTNPKPSPATARPAAVAPPAQATPPEKQAGAPASPAAAPRPAAQTPSPPAAPLSAAEAAPSGARHVITIYLPGATFAEQLAFWCAESYAWFICSWAPYTPMEPGQSQQPRALLRAMDCVPLGSTLVGGSTRTVWGTQTLNGTSCACAADSMLLGCTLVGESCARGS